MKRRHLDSYDTDLIENCEPTCPYCTAEIDIFDLKEMPIDLTDQGPHLFQCPQCDRWFLVSLSWRFTSGAQYQESLREALVPSGSGGEKVEMVRQERIEFSVTNKQVIKDLERLGWSIVDPSKSTNTTGAD